MATKPKAGFATKTSSQNYSTKWLRNALKSVGISSQEALKEISPNLYEVTSAGVTTSRNIINSLRRNSNSSQRIGETLKSNKYVQYAQKAYRNAMADIKSGNFNNQDRMNDSMQSSLTGDLGDLKEGFSFGDDGADSAVNVNYINAGNNGAILNLSNQIQNQAKAQVATQKASMDAYIAVNAASMQQVGQIGAEIVGQLTNVNNNLAALVQYQNQNMTRFIEASLAYYDHAGAAMSGGKSGSGSNSRITAKDVMGSGSGGVNMARYKSYVKQQAKDLFEHSNIGLIKSIADDPMMMDMMVSNPIGFLSQGLIGHMIPTVLKTSIETMETTFTNFMPTMLSKIADLADTEGNDFVSKFKRVLGKTFGLRNERTTKMGQVEIKRDAIPFDGETKHAITEIITKELRDQTGYLEIIANHFAKGKAKEQARESGEFWSYNKNKYINRKDIDMEIADKIVDSIRDAFNDTKFGKALKTDLIDTRRSDAAKKEMAFTIDELFVEIEKQKGHVSLSDLVALIESGGATRKTKDTIIKYIKKMSYQNRGAFGSLNTGRLNSQGAAEETRKGIMEDYIGNNLLNSSFMGDEDADEILKRVKQYGEWSDKKARRVRGIHGSTQTSGNLNSANRNNHQGKMASMLERATGGAVSIMESLMNGDTGAVISKGASFIGKGLEAIGEKLNKEAQKEGGIVWQVKENFKSMSTDIKDGIMMKFFGKKRDENGKYVKDESEKGGLFGSLTGIFKTGFNGWIDAFFGEEGEDAEKNREKHKKDIAAAIKDALPNAITGTVIGAGVGAMAGHSFLGMLVGGAYGGAILGAATGFLSKNEKFQQWLFGKDNEDGSHTEGLISKKVQDYFKANKTKLVGSAAVGAVVGAKTGGGILGYLVGGPIAGSIMGMAGTVLATSDTFKKVLYGDKENGQKGLFKAVADAFNKGYKKNSTQEKSADGKKALGMGLIGSGVGAITSKILIKQGVIGAAFSPFGPIGGAIAGLALSIKAQSGNLRNWLFGEKDGLKLGDGRKIKKQGVLGQIGNMLTANIINPMKHEIQYIAKDFMSTMKGKVLYPFAFLAEKMSEKFGALYGKLTEQVTGAVKGLFSFAGDTVKALFAPTVEAIGGIMKTATDATWKIMKHTISTPGKLAVAVVKALDLKDKFNNIPFVKFFKGLGKDIRKLVFDGIKGVFKLIGGIVAAPFKLLGFGIGKLWQGTKWLAGKAGDGIKNVVGKSKVGSKIISAYQGLTRGKGDENDSLLQRMRRSKDTYKKEQAEIAEMKKNNKMHDKNAKMIARASKGQFGADTDEARTWLKYNRPDLYKKLEGTLSITEETEIEKHGKSTKGMDLERAKLNELSDEGKQTKLLFDIRHILDVFMHQKQGDKDAKYENDEERDAREASEIASKAKKKSHIDRRRKWLEYEGYMIYTGEKNDKYTPGDIRNSNFTKITDPSSIPQKVLDFAQQVRDEGIPEAPKPMSLKDKVIQGFKNVKNYFKKDFFSNTRKFAKERDKDWSSAFLAKKTKGQFTEDSYEARQWLQVNDPEAYAKFLSKVTGRQVASHSVGGVIKKGLSILGEKGAELLFKSKDGKTSVLDAESTEEAIEDATRKKKKKNKLTKWIQKVSAEDSTDSALENHSDEERADNRIAAYFKSKRAKKGSSGMEAAAEASLATLLERADLRRDSKTAALTKAKTHDELKKEKEEEKAREEQKKYQEAMLKQTTENTESTKNYHSTWDKLWNPKKGIIAIAGIAAFAWLKKKFPGLISAVESIAKGLADFLGGAISETVKDIMWTQDKAARTDGNTMAEEAAQTIQDFKDGNIMTDANGNIKARGESILKVGARTAMNFMNSAHHMPFESKITKIEKGVFNAGKKIGGVTKNLVGKAGNYLDNTKELAKWALAEGDDVLAAGTKMEQLGAKVMNSKAGQFVGNVVNKGKGLADNAVQAVTNSKIGKGVSKAKTSVKNFGDDMVKNIKNTGKGLADAVATKAKKDDGILSKVCKYVDDFFSFIKDKFLKKTGVALGDDALGKVAKDGILKGLKNNWDNLCAKIAAKLGAGTTAAAVSFGLSEAIFATIGAINGVSGTAKLFHVDSKAVDGTMRLIGGIFGALTGTTVGGIIDLVFSLLGPIFGCDILHSLATSMYKVIVGKDSKKAAKLEDAQASFKNAYEEERNTTLKKQYETQLKAGLIGKDVTFEMFVAGVEDGTYEASYTSFDDWNTQQNKSIGDHIIDGAGKAIKGIGKGAKAAGKFLFGGKETTYTDKNGNTYTKNEDGTYQVRDANGTDLGSISKKALPKDAEKSVTKTKGIIGKGLDAGKNLLSKAGTGLKNFGKGVVNVGKKAGKAVGNAAKKAGKAAGNVAKSAGKAVGGFFKGVGKKLFGSKDKKEEKKSDAKIKAKDAEVNKTLEDVKTKMADKAKDMLTTVSGTITNVYSEIKEKGISGFLGGLFKKEPTTAWFDSQGNYYKPSGEGTYVYCNVNGDVLEEGIPESKVQEMSKTGLLTKGEIPGESKAQKAVGKIKNAIGKLWDKAPDGVKNIVEGAKEKAGAIVDKVKGGVTKAKDAVKGAVSKGIGKIKSLFSGKGGGYGEIVNGQPYFSQNDSRWGNKSYTSGTDRATMSNTGCGPTALAMVAAGMGKNASPMGMADLAKATGNRDASGTNWNFVNDVSPMVGLSSRQKLNPSAKDIDAQLASGNPVLLSGVGSGSGSDPYTSAGHYVVAVGKDANNNVLINDPRGKSYSKAYNLNNVASKTGSSWSFGGRGYYGGYGRLYRGYGGRGDDNGTVTVSTKNGNVTISYRDLWIATVQAVKQAMAAQSPGYSQTNYIKITIGGKTISVRTDCSGMVGGAAKFFDGIGLSDNIHSRNMLDSSCPLAKKGCFTIQAFPGWDNLQPGDILVKSGHTEVYAGKMGDEYYVYDCGSTSNVNNPGTTVRSFKEYTHIWKPVKPGANAIKTITPSGFNASAAASSSSSASATVAGDTTSATSGNAVDKFGQLTSYMGSFFSEFGNRVLSGNFNTDYSNIDPTSTASAETTGGSGSGTSLSRRSRSARTTQSGRGGYGLIDYSSKQGIQIKRSREQLNMAGNAQKYINVSKDSSMKALMMNAIEILAAIAGNTSDASTKLNALNNLQNLSTSGSNSTNVIVPNGNNTTNVVQSGSSAKGESRDTTVARQLARGGY